MMAKKKTSKKKEKLAGPDVVDLRPEFFDSEFYDDKRSRPDLADLRWEVLRRTSRYKNICKKLKNAPKSVNKAAFKRKWKITEIADPSLSWKKFDSPPTRFASPMYRKYDAIVLVPEDDAYYPVRSFGFKIKEETKDFNISFDDNLWLKINPHASLKNIYKDIKKRVEMCRKASKAKIKERIEWLEIVDKVEQHKIKSIPKTITKIYGYNYEIRRRRLDQYTKGRLLLEKPLTDPLRNISEKRINTYQIKHNLKSVRNKK